MDLAYDLVQLQNIKRARHAQYLIFILFINLVPSYERHGAGIYLGGLSSPLLINLKKQVIKSSLKNGL